MNVKNYNEYPAITKNIIGKIELNDKHSKNEKHAYKQQARYYQG